MRKVTTKWTMRDGRKIRICDMEDSHLLNALRMVQRDPLIVSGICDGFVTEGDVMEDPMLEPLLEEARRRGFDI